MANKAQLGNTSAKLLSENKNMRRSIILLIVASIGLFSCGQGHRSVPHDIDTGTVTSIEKVQRQKTAGNSNKSNIYTQYEYADSIGKSLVIQNSFPKSGIHYTDPTGKKYVYAVFWSRIVNETDNPCELAIDFPVEPFELPSAPGVYLRLFCPPDTMTIDKEPLYDYGLAGLKPFLDSSLSKSSLLKRTVKPKESSAFYVITLSEKGVGGTLRTGFILKGQDVFCSINKTEILCGRVNLKRLILQKQL